MEIVKFILILLLSLIIGFGFWYLIFWFVSSESNLFIWGPWTKAFYLIFGFTSSGKTLEEIVKI
jgi:hypothetical protein